MKFTDLDKKMRVFETAHDHCVLPGMYMVARIDGRCFSTLTKETLDFEAPYDVRFRDFMVETIKHLMKCGFRVKFAYSQSDEINLLFDMNETTFSRKLRKYNSVLAAEASAFFSLQLNRVVAFDCRISQIPNREELLNYFKWRSDDAFRNALNGHCYWYYRGLGFSDKESHEKLMGVSNAKKNDILFKEANINFNDLPAWHKRGFALYFENVEKKGVNPKTGEEVISYRSQIKVDMELPMKEAFDDLVLSFS